MPTLQEIIERRKKEKLKTSFNDDFLNENISTSTPKEQPAPTKKDIPPKHETRNEKKRKTLDINKILLTIKSLDEEKNPLYQVIIRRAKSGRKSYLESVLSFVNKQIREGVDIYE